MYKIKYLAARPMEKDPIAGLPWAVGEIKDIESRDSASYLLFHSDTFADVRSKKQRDADPITPVEKPLTVRRFDDDVPMIDTSRMGEAALQLYAGRMLGKSLDKAPLPVMRNQLSSEIARRNL